MGLNLLKTLIPQELKEPRTFIAFVIVIGTYLLTLLVFVFFSSGIPTNIMNNATAAKIVLDSRTDTIKTLLAVSGVWVGAVVAFYFGSENLKQTTQSMLQMKELTPREILTNLTVSDVTKDSKKQFREEDLFKSPDSLGKLVRRFELLEERGFHPWFAVVVDATGKLEHVIHKELADRYIIANVQRSGRGAGVTVQSIEKDTLSKVIAFGTKKYPHLLDKEVYIQVDPHQTLLAVQNAMDQRNVFLAISLAGNRPVGFMTTGDIRKKLAEQ